MSQDATEDRHYRICPLCEACCGLEVRTRGGRVTAIRGAADDPFSRGYLCPKGYALKDLHEDPDRLRQPLVRRAGRLVEASWDEAFADIEQHLPALQQRHGRDAVAVSVGNPSAHRMGLLLYFARLAKSLGTRNVYSASTLDQMPKQLACGLMFGHWLSIPVPDIDRTDLLVVIGGNPAVSNGSLWTVPDFRGRARALRARGGRLVVVDPRRTETAELADQHLPLRPGADACFLAALAQVLFAEGRVNLGRLAAHVNGLPELQAALAPFTPERVAERCGLPAEALRTLARELAAAPRAVVYGRLGTCTQRFGSVASWLVDVLNVLTGHLDAPGGAMFPRAAAFAANTQGTAGRGRGVASGRWHSRVSGAPEVFGELPMGVLAEEMETPGAGQVKALITVASNPVLSAPDGPRLAAALERLDYMVSLDLYLNETARHAHVVLPALSALEISHYDVAFPQLSMRNHARYSGAVFAPPPSHPPEWQILLKLAAIARGLGAGADVLALDDALVLEDVRQRAGDAAPALLRACGDLRGPERLLELALRSGPYGDGFGERPEGLTLARVQAAPAGLDLGPLQPRIPELLRTPSGRIELAPPTLVADLAQAAADLEAPRPALVLIGRREVRSNNSWMHNLPVLAKGPERCTVQVHPDDARRLGLHDGGRAALQAAGRRLEVTVEYTDALAPGVVSLPHGWGHALPGTRLRVAAERPGVNMNALLTAEARDPLSGNAVLSGVPVTMSALP